MRLFQVLAVFFCALGTLEAHQALRMLLQKRAAATMRQISGRFLLSLNDVPEVREIFRWADMESVKLTYSVSASGNAHAARELLITGPA